MPGHVKNAAELRQELLSRAEIGVARAAIIVRDAGSFLAPKRTDELASEIQANRTVRSGDSVTSRVHTNSEEYYGIPQETKDWYHHRTGQSRYMANALLQSIPRVAAEIRDAIGEL